MRDPELDPDWAHPVVTLFLYSDYFGNRQSPGQVAVVISGNPRSPLPVVRHHAGQGRAGQGRAGQGRAAL